ncbi:hypothetical protein [Parasphingopyxis sp.]|uniref:hypothetical protein n=1 Tax=Parasphingopyxis sp. TaxID=1920299 RepID=UPI0026308C97|nr:hypothetical protein [Parasphingopyxis sp.]
MKIVPKLRKRSSLKSIAPVKRSVNTVREKSLSRSRTLPAVAHTVAEPLGEHQPILRGNEIPPVERTRQHLRQFAHN